MRISDVLFYMLCLLPIGCSVPKAVDYPGFDFYGRLDIEPPRKQNRIATTDMYTYVYLSSEASSEIDKQLMFDVFMVNDGATVWPCEDGKLVSGTEPENLNQLSRIVFRALENNSAPFSRAPKYTYDTEVKGCSYFRLNYTVLLTPVEP